MRPPLQNNFTPASTDQLHHDAFIGAQVQFLDRVAAIHVRGEITLPRPAA
ncbi:hypothetical protein [Candidatus Flexifilum breve]